MATIDGRYSPESPSAAYPLEFSPTASDNEAGQELKQPKTVERTKDAYARLQKFERKYVENISADKTVDIVDIIVCVRSDTNNQDVKTNSKEYKEVARQVAQAYRKPPQEEEDEDKISLTRLNCTPFHRFHRLTPTDKHLSDPGSSSVSASASASDSKLQPSTGSNKETSTVTKRRGSFDFWRRP